MKTIITSLLLALVVAPAFAQSNKSIKAVSVTDVSVLTSFGYLASYTVTFKNTSSKTIDQINWTVNYYDNAGNLIKSEKESYNADSFIDPISSGFEKTLARAPRIKGASRAQVVITSAHSADGTTFKP
jgi:hypothetical protein